MTRAHQMWRLSATLDAYLARHGDATLPGAVISGVLFLRLRRTLSVCHSSGAAEPSESLVK